MITTIEQFALELGVTVKDVVEQTAKFWKELDKNDLVSRLSVTLRGELNLWP